MAKAMIITVGAQVEQIKYCIENNQPQYLVLLGTNSEECKNGINELLQYYNKIFPTNYKIFCEIDDHPKSIGEIIKCFREGYDWIKRQDIKDEEIEVDLTGGRKWMSAGVTMIASFLGLKMIYVEAKYKNGKPDPTTMKIIPVGNAYEQTGFLEETKADRLFNENNFVVASSIYEFLTQKISDPRKIEIKKLISDSYYFWSQFKFNQSLDSLILAIQKIEQYGFENFNLPRLKTQCEILKILAKNDDKDVKFYDLLKNDNFIKQMLLTLTAQSDRYSQNKQYDQAVILLYRILELIAQHRLAKNNIYAGEISPEVQTKYKDEYKRLTKIVFQAESEIPDKIALIQGWILLYCIKDELVKKETEEFLSGLRRQTEPRNLLWWEHGNRTIDENSWKKFRSYVVENWLTKIFPNWKEEIEKHHIIKF